MKMVISRKGFLSLKINKPLTATSYEMSNTWKCLNGKNANNGGALYSFSLVNIYWQMFKSTRITQISEKNQCPLFIDKALFISRSFRVDNCCCATKERLLWAKTFRKMQWCRKVAYLTNEKRSQNRSDCEGFWEKGRLQGEFCGYLIQYRYIIISFCSYN